MSSDTDTASETDTTVTREEGDGQVGDAPGTMETPVKVARTNGVKVSEVKAPAKQRKKWTWNNKEKEHLKKVNIILCVDRS